MNELQKLIKKWDEQIALHRRVCDDPLMYTKEDRLKNSYYAQALCAVVADLKKLTIPVVSNPLSCDGCKYHNTTNDDLCGACGDTYKNKVT